MKTWGEREKEEEKGKSKRKKTEGFHFGKCTIFSFLFLSSCAMEYTCEGDRSCHNRSPETGVCRIPSYVPSAEAALNVAINQGIAERIRAALHGDGLNVNYTRQVDHEDDVDNPLVCAVRCFDTRAMRLVLAHPKCQINKAGRNLVNVLFNTWPGINFKEVVEFLVLHPDISLMNPSCLYNVVFRALDSPQDVTRPMFDWLIASGKTILDDSQSYEEWFAECDWPEAAESEMEKIELEFARYEQDKWGHVRRARKQLGLPSCGAVVFSYLMFTHEDTEYLRVRPGMESSPLARFIRMARGLPQEVQMLLCNMIFEDPSDLIPSRDRERAFQSLAHNLREDDRALAYLKAYVPPPPLFSQQ
jgi:hypothetical protein